jgi:ketosteroid isomerase-like protein
MSANKELEIEQITDLINKLVNMRIAKTPFLDIWAPGAITIRPTGNPMGQKLWEEMQASEDVVFESSELLNIDKIDVCEGASSVSSTSMAYAIFTAHSKFTYKGTHNDDVAVFTIIAKKNGDQWKIVHAQRSTGRKPDDPQPGFSNL